jgi:hypothetical protein
VVLETRWDGLASMSIALLTMKGFTKLSGKKISNLDELDHLALLFVSTPSLEFVEIGKDEGVAVVGVS